MLQSHERPPARQVVLTFGVLGWMFVAVGTARCSPARPVDSPTNTTLRVGVGQVVLTSPPAGLQQVVSNLSLKGLLNLNEDGRPRPWTAQSWIAAPNGLSLRVQLRPEARFHDGTPVTAP